MEGIELHPAVRKGMIETEGGNEIINFNPPDGEFNLLSYRVPINVRVPLSPSFPVVSFEEMRV